MIISYHNIILTGGLGSQIIRFLSGIGKYKVDCKAKKQTWLTVSLYSLNMGKGRILSDDKPKQIIRTDRWGNVSHK